MQFSIEFQVFKGFSNENRAILAADRVLARDKGLNCLARSCQASAIDEIEAKAS